jgi:hypothetical protein
MLRFLQVLAEQFLDIQARGFSFADQPQFFRIRPKSQHNVPLYVRQLFQTTATQKLRNSHYAPFDEKKTIKHC